MKTWHDVVDVQGWSQTEQVILLLKFVSASGLANELAEFAVEVAVTQNRVTSMAAVDAPTGELTLERYAELVDAAQKDVQLTRRDVEARSKFAVQRHAKALHRLRWLQDRPPRLK